MIFSSRNLPLMNVEMVIMLMHMRTCFFGARFVVFPMQIVLQEGHKEMIQE